jgi:hypothetical protein
VWKSIRKAWKAWKAWNWTKLNITKLNQWTNECSNSAQCSAMQRNAAQCSAGLNEVQHHAFLHLKKSPGSKVDPTSHELLWIALNCLWLLW